jgi:cytochrome c oxidase subunit 2
MFYLIGLLSVIFFALAINVISKSIKLNKSLAANENTGEALDSSNNANAYGMIIFWALGTIAGVWSFMVAKPDFLPIAASEHGLRTDSMFWVSMAVVTFAFFATNT